MATNGNGPNPLNNPYDHWVGMPDHEQENIVEHQMIKIRFRNEEDVKAFSKLVGQTITPKTKYIWFPEETDDEMGRLRWV